MTEPKENEEPAKGESVQEELVVNVEEYGFDDDGIGLKGQSSTLLKKNTPSFTCLAQCELSQTSLLGIHKFPILKDPGLDQDKPAGMKETKSNIARRSSYVSQSHEESNDFEKYEAMCKDLNIATCSRFMGNLFGDTLNLKYYGVNLNQMKAMAVALKVNVNIKTLDLEENYLTPEATGIIADLLTENGTLRVLNMKECRIGPEGAERLNEGIQSTQFIQELDLSFNNLQNSGINALLTGLCDNTSIKILNLGHNLLSEECCPDLEKILIENYFIQELDLSWNFLNTATGLKKLTNGLKSNPNITSLNLSWNGLEEKPPMVQLCKYIRRSSLRHLDLSGNRLTGPPLKQLRNAVNRNKTLEFVSLANNCLTASEANSFANLLLTKDNLKTLNMESTVVEKSFIKIRDKIKNLGKTVIVGHILGNYDIKGPDIKKLLFDRCKFLAMKPKKKKAKKDFGHVILSLPENPIFRTEFEATIKKLKVKKIDADLITELLKQFKAAKGKINTEEMVKSYMSYFPDTVLPPPKEKKKKGKKGKEGKGKDKGKTEESPNLNKAVSFAEDTHKSGMQLMADSKALIERISATLLGKNVTQAELPLPEPKISPTEIPETEVMSQKLSQNILPE